MAAMSNVYATTKLSQTPSSLLSCHLISTSRRCKWVTRSFYVALYLMYENGIFPREPCTFLGFRRKRICAAKWRSEVVAVVHRPCSLFFGDACVSCGGSPVEIVHKDVVL